MVTNDATECILTERKTALIEDSNKMYFVAFYKHLKSFQKMIYEEDKFWWFAKLIISINRLRRSWNNFFLVRSEDGIFYFIPDGGT